MSSQTLAVTRCALMMKTVKLCAEALMANGEGRYVLPVEGVTMTLLQKGAQKESKATGKSGLVEFSAKVPQNEMGTYEVRAELGPGVSTSYAFRETPTQNVETSATFLKTGRAYVHKITFYFNPNGWIGVRVVNEAGTVFTGVTVSLKWPDKSVATRKLSRGDLRPDGTYRLDRIPNGVYQVSLPEIDQDLWTQQPPKPAGGAAVFEERSPYAAPPGDTHTVVAGDCVWSLAVKYNIPEDEIWKDDRNLAITNKYKNKYTLLPGARLKIPKPRVKAQSCNANAAYDFVVKDRPREVVVRFMDRGKPAAAGVTGKLKIAGSADQDVTTDGAGEIRFMAPQSATEATLDIPDIGLGAYKLMLGGVSPVESKEGVKQRLSNLGYYVEPASGEAEDLKAEFERAVKAFQDTNGIPAENPKPDGTVNQATIDALVKVCGA